MASTKFYLAAPYKKSTKTGKNILNDKETRIYLFLYLGRSEFEKDASGNKKLLMIRIKTEWSILPKEWDFKKQIRKENLAGSIEFNKKLTDKKTETINKYEELRKDYPDMPFKQLRQKLQRYFKEKELPELKGAKTMEEIFAEYIASLEGKLKPGSIKKAKTLRNVLIGVPDEEIKPRRKYPPTFIDVNKEYCPLTFSMIDYMFYNKFVYFLRNKKATGGRQKNRPEGEQDGLLEDTVGKYIESLKTFCGWAENWGYNKYRTYKEFKQTSTASRKCIAKKNGARIVTLTLPELKQLYYHDFSKNPRLERIRDLFCFACFTGQRWGDITTIDINDIIGKDIWKLTAEKTSHETEIDLIGFHTPALDILKKYSYELPKISSQKFNAKIKEVGKEAGIDAPVKIERFVGSKKIIIEKPKYQFMSSHMGRRTCVSILLNDYGMSVTYVMSITGHTSVATLEKYINKDRGAQRRAAEKQINAMEKPKAPKKEAV